MSLLKRNMDSEFENQTVGDADFKELRDLQDLQQEWEHGNFLKLPDCIQHLNSLNRISLTAKIVEPFKEAGTKKCVIKGRYRGMIYTETNQTFRTLKSIIESYGFIILKEWFLEESDEKFTNISFTIKE